jgi:hypothetical protein
LAKVRVGRTTVKLAVAVNEVLLADVSPLTEEFFVTHSTSARFVYAPGIRPERIVAL